MRTFMAAPSLLERLAGTPIARRTAETIFNLYASRRARRLNRQRIGEVQGRTLLGLVRRARHTRFGRDHDFAGLRSVADFQQCVPLRDYDAFWKDYWQQAFPGMTDATW